jgi:hypothetical protein
MTYADDALHLVDVPRVHHEKSKILRSLPSTPSTFASSSQERLGRPRNPREHESTGSGVGAGVTGATVVGAGAVVGGGATVTEGHAFNDVSAMAYDFVDVETLYEIGQATSFCAPVRSH